MDRRSHASALATCSMRSASTATANAKEASSGRTRAAAWAKARAVAGAPSRSAHRAIRRHVPASWASSTLSGDTVRMESRRRGARSGEGGRTWSSARSHLGWAARVKREARASTGDEAQRVTERSACQSTTPRPPRISSRISAPSSVSPGADRRGGGGGEGRPGLFPGAEGLFCGILNPVVRFVASWYDSRGQPVFQNASELTTEYRRRFWVLSGVAVPPTDAVSGRYTWFGGKQVYRAAGTCPGRGGAWNCP